MVSLSTPKDFRRLRDTSFCYLCGSSLRPDDQLSRDHVPPRAAFAALDRIRPLILPVHSRCNNSRAEEDELIARVISPLFGQSHPKHGRRLELEIYYATDTLRKAVALRGVPLKQIIWRWVRACHAALYQEFLPDDCGGKIHAPFPKVQPGAGHRAYACDDNEDRYALTRALRQNRVAGRVDTIDAWNGRFQYICSWMRFDDGCPFCLFALRLYGWEKLGDPHLPPRRGCLGWYFCKTPLNASEGTTIEIPVSSVHPLDPFFN